MTLDDIRGAVLLWGQSAGILTDSLQLHVQPDADISLVPFADDATDYFRRRRIARIVADENANRLIIFTTLKIGEPKIKALRQSFAERYLAHDFQLDVEIASRVKVDGRLATRGRFEPVRRVNGATGAICCGSSIGIGNHRNAGTLTALASKNGQLVGLSCNHVTGGCSTALPGTPVVSPGIQDVSRDHAEITVIGKHAGAANMAQGLPEVIDIENNRDLAWFSVEQPELLSSRQGTGDESYDTPSRFASPQSIRKGLPVKKWGRSTKLTTGIVQSVVRDGESLDYNITSYFGPTASQNFNGTVYYGEVIVIRSTSGEFSLGGDSGALVVTNVAGKTPKVVGILIGGDARASFVLPLQQACKDHQLKLISGHND
ncbi:MAG: hypothetical protein NXI04_15650 [Planctomycetaceae bacterium]|nr:hypothetical protein [Planctomycetaceae bacterium]